MKKFHPEEKSDIKNRFLRYYGMMALVSVLFLLFVWFLEITNLCAGCWLQRTTGIYCPWCGGSRMLVLVLALNFRDAFWFNPFVFATLIPMIIVILCQGYCYIIKKRNMRGLVVIVGIYIGMAVIFAILRNIPKFAILAP